MADKVFTRRWIMTVPPSVMSLILAGCSSDQTADPSAENGAMKDSSAAFFGSWSVTSVEDETGAGSATISEDGKWSWTSPTDPESWTGTWSLDGNQFEVAATGFEDSGRKSDGEPGDVGRAQLDRGPHNVQVAPLSTVVAAMTEEDLIPENDSGILDAFEDVLRNSPTLKAIEQLDEQSVILFGDSRSAAVVVQIISPTQVHQWGRDRFRELVERGVRAQPDLVYRKS